MDIAEPICFGGTASNPKTFGFHYQYLDHLTGQHKQTIRNCRFATDELLQS